MMEMGLMYPCMQSCMMQQPFTMASSSSSMMGMGSMVPCMQSCMMQQPFSMVGSPFLAMMLQQSPWAMQQQCCSQKTMIQGMMSPQCHCGSMCQIMQMQQSRMATQLPLVWNRAAMMVQPNYYKQPFSSWCAC
ncbi:hypothetical protein HU200_002448 [Digitaria exilis]|uniref:Uncharacterized protein n=1 Tax=Digitaria exilis TaxID=1010633 RepID=A0A835FX79_9POAL|nr:hypothetical protein HU200_002448 [Digitaria exilis]